MTCPCSGSTLPKEQTRSARSGGRRNAAAPVGGPASQPDYTWNGPQGRKKQTPAAAQPPAA